MFGPDERSRVRSFSVFRELIARSDYFGCILEIMVVDLDDILPGVTGRLNTVDDPVDVELTGVRQTALAVLPVVYVYVDNIVPHRVEHRERVIPAAHRLLQVKTNFMFPAPIRSRTSFMNTGLPARAVDTFSCASVTPSLFATEMRFDTTSQ